MNSIATKIAKKVSVFFEYDHRDAGARQQEPEHHSRWSTTRNAAASCYLMRAIQRHITPNGITMIASRNEADCGQAYPKTWKRNGLTSRYVCKAPRVRCNAPDDTAASRR